MRCSMRHFRETHVLYQCAKCKQKHTSVDIAIHRHATLIKTGKSRGTYRVFIERPEGKRPLGKPRYVWEDGIKTDIREIALEGMDFIPAKFRVQIWTSSLDIRAEHCYTFLILP